MITIPVEALDWMVSVFRTYNDPYSETVIRLVKEDAGLLTYVSDPNTITALSRLKVRWQQEAQSWAHA